VKGEPESDDGKGTKDLWNSGRSFQRCGAVWDVAEFENLQ